MKASRESKSGRTYVYAKGQIISKANYGVLNSSKKCTETHKFLKRMIRALYYFKNSLVSIIYDVA